MYVRKNLNQEETRVYRAMIAVAYKMAGPFTTADLLKKINHNLDTSQQRHLGRKFSSYADRNAFVVVGNKGRNLIYRKV